MFLGNSKARCWNYGKVRDFKRDWKEEKKENDYEDEFKKYSQEDGGGAFVLSWQPMHAKVHGW